MSVRLLPPRSTARRRIVGRATLVVSVAGLVATPLWWGATRPQVEAGVVPASGRSPVSALRLDQTLWTVPSIQIASARLADREAGPTRPQPSRIRIAAIAVDAAIVPVGIDEPTGSMQVPADISKAGWYRFGSSPGQQGSSLVVGHVDSAARGPGVFFHLRDLPVGAVVSVAFTDGSSKRFRVVARRSYPKTDLPGRLFTRSGNPVLTLITCGGAFNRTTGHYEDNVVVYAVPIEA